MDHKIAVVSKNMLGMRSTQTIFFEGKKNESCSVLYYKIQYLKF